MSKTITHIRSPARETIAPRREIEARLLSELHINAALANAFAAHAREVCLAAHLQGEAAIEYVIPHVPFGGARRVHRADEIACAVRHRNANLHRADAVHGRDGEIRQL